MTAVERSRVDLDVPAVRHGPTAGATVLDRVRRTGAALALVLAPWGLVVTNALYYWSTRNGGDDSTGARALALVAPQPGLFRILLLAGMLGSLLLVPAVLAAMRLAPRSWPAFVGGTLMVAGYIGYFGVLLSNSTIIAMAEHGGPVADFAAVIDAGQQDATTGWVFLLFIAGNLLGTLLLAVGLLRSRATAVWAAVLILLWPPLHVVGLVVGNELFEVAGAIMQAAGLAGVAVAVLRAPSSHQPQQAIQ
jgi:hypothetical protein